MGIKLVTAALRYSAAQGLTDSACRILVAMASFPLDSDPNPAYFGGLTTLAERTGHIREGETDPHAIERGRESLKKAINRMMKVTWNDFERPDPSAKGASRQVARRGKTARYSVAFLKSWVEKPSADSTEQRDLSTPVRDDKSSPLSPALGETDGPVRGDNLSELGGQSVRHKEEEREMKEEGTPAPSKSCKRHPSWDHDEACRACMRDRQRAERFESVRALPKVANPSPRLHELSSLERSQVDNHVRGFGEIPERLGAAADEARQERERVA